MECQAQAEYSKRLVNQHTLTSIKNQSVGKKHSNCFIETMFNNSEFLYRDTTYYTLMSNNLTDSMRYDHLCPYMKTRYNCGTKEKAMYGGNAYDWKLMLRDQGREERVCNLWDLINDLQGPAGIGKKVLDDWQTRQGSDRIKRANKTMINVAMLGNSFCVRYLRVFYVHGRMSSHFLYLKRMENMTRVLLE